MIKLLEKLQSKQTKSQGGFTLIELLIVVLIIGILAAIAIPVFNNQRDKARDSAAQSAVRNALSAAKSAQATNDNGNYVNTEVNGELTSGGFTVDNTTAAASWNLAAAANPEEIWHNAAATPGGSTIKLCSASESGTVFCLSDTGAKTSGPTATAGTTDW